MNNSNIKGTVIKVKIQYKEEHVSIPTIESNFELPLKTLTKETSRKAIEIGISRYQYTV